MADSESRISASWKTISVVLPIVFAMMSTILYVLRVCASRITNGSCRVDDYLTGIGLLLSYAATGATLQTSFIDVGPAFGDSSEEESRLKYGNWLVQDFWPMSIGFIKLGVIFFLKHVFAIKTAVSRCLNSLGIFIILWMISASLISIFQCWPISYFYDEHQAGHCIPSQAFSAAIGALALLGDSALLIIPLHPIWTLKISLRQKLAATCLLSLGIFACSFRLFRVMRSEKASLDYINYLLIYQSQYQLSNSVQSQMWLLHAKSFHGRYIPHQEHQVRFQA
ncbi:uncharacterized protein TRIVIDRAFT_201472 [Trichoderma virens Gv29-8]|uniref:Rhodopsin domain-containing protein n=1 Tax=Hypocrea virens (strain Gv29-8 / FGSC 10586) TaxID=413071 RepID=G9MU05_HYPVG|nr:uncharacterized protein TRIVIDRAFT_201472 [Trichoderma virens Gv29-8]EHK22075.1 hypothetical protein TRIVIDRAFT_201472 [Trichoderma virens Gv29-8]UKZ57131.1 hypothetical protein TrVGV298_010983 [Trichoderma virens]